MTPEELRQRAANVARHAVAAKLREFSHSPVGVVVKAMGKEIIEAQKSGKDLTPSDLFAFALRVPDILEKEFGVDSPDSPDEETCDEE